jgi:hypothetical protein
MLEVRRRQGRLRLPPVAAAAPAGGAEKEPKGQLRPRRAGPEPRRRAVCVHGVARGAAQQQHGRARQGLEAEQAVAWRGAGRPGPVAPWGLRERAPLPHARRAGRVTAQPAARVPARQAARAGRPQLGAALGTTAHLRRAQRRAGLMACVAMPLR